MQAPRTHAISIAAADGQTHRMVCYDWGDPANKDVVVCVHGLTRNGRDFDFLADRLSKSFRVISMTMPGRGESEWLKEPAGYNNGAYLQHILTMLDALDVKRFRWVGTSMGGILGMMIAAIYPDKVQDLVINDIGAYIYGSGMERLRGYVGKRVLFDNRAEGESAIREIFAPFGLNDEKHWQHMFTHSLQDLPDGKVRMAYDPALGNALHGKEKLDDIPLWEVWNKIQCPVLLLRGEKSDILTRETADEMQKGPIKVTYKEFPGVGHAPTLMKEDEIYVVENWLQKAKEAAPALPESAIQRCS